MIDQHLDHCLGPRARLLIVTVAVLGEGHKRIRGVGHRRLVATLLLCFLGDGLRERLKCSQQHPSRLGSEQGVEPEGSVVISPVAQTAAPADRLVTLCLRAERRGPDLSLIHISEPTRRTPISYAVFCLKK